VAKIKVAIGQALSIGRALQFAAWFGGIVAGTVAAGLADLSPFFRVLLFVGVGGFVASLLTAVVQVLPRSLREQAIDREAQEHARQVRGAVNRVLAELEHNRKELDGVSLERDFVQGQWLKDHEFLSGEPALQKAYEITNDAYQLIARVPDHRAYAKDALSRIEDAKQALNEALREIEAS
jgi:hypothetical protein